MDFIKTKTLLAAVKQEVPVSSFLKDRYFPTNDATDLFNSDEVVVEYMDGDQAIAPFVVPRKNGVEVMREGYSAKAYEPANIAPKMGITVDDLKRKGLGEALFSGLSPEARQIAMLTEDAKKMNRMIVRREEAMAAETMLNNSCVVKEIADDKSLGIESTIKFFDGAVNPAIYTPSTKWDAAGADIFGDLRAMIKFLTSAGNAASDVVVGADVADAIQKNAEIQKYLDNRRFDLGNYNPQLTDDGTAVILCRLNVFGHMMNVITYDQTYKNEAGAIVPFIPANQIVVTAPGAGKTAYGCVTQLEQADGEFHSYVGKRVPKYVADVNNNVRTLTLTARPLMMPKAKNPWISATVL